MQFISDCRVVRSAACGTDHHLVCVTYRLPSVSLPPVERRRPRRFAVRQLIVAPGMSDGERELVQCTRTEYCHDLGSRLRATVAADASVEQQWSGIKSAVTDSAKSVLGYVKRTSSDWFVSSAVVLLPLIQRHNELYRRFCLSQSPEDGIVFRQARAESRRAIVTAKEKWLGRQAAVVEAGRFSTKSAWNAIRAIKTCYGGLVSTPSQAIRGSDGDLCSSQSAVLARWHQHFSSVLNVMSTFATSVFDSLPSRGIDESLAEAPSEEEIGVALRQLQNGKAPGRSGIVSELLKYGEAPLSPYILDLFCSIWLAGAVPQEWRDAQLIPIPKKGDLSLCDNWRGISLLDVVGKLLGRLL